jgi:selenocysteine lyase/cysteine desulfurase
MTATPGSAGSGPRSVEGAGHDPARLREQEFPWAMAGEAVYLNNASTGPLPRRTVEAVADFTARRAMPWMISEEDQFGTLRRSRELCARLIGAQPADIALMVNTSYGINLAARSLPLESGDVVLTNDREFPANIYPWLALEKRGVRLERVACIDGLPDEDALIRAMDVIPRVRIVTTSWVSFATGYTVDLERLGAACRERGIWFVVDAIQGLGALTLDVSKLPIDVLACGAQKWLLSPWGTGFVYVNPELVQRLEPEAVGWLATRASEDFGNLLAYDLTWLPDARRFEVITLPFQEFAGLNASLELLFEIGLPAVKKHIARLVGRIMDWTESQPGVGLLSAAQPSRRSGIVTLKPGDLAAAAARLTAAKVIFSVREGAIRLAPHCYNTIEEIDITLGALEGAVRSR